MEKEPAFTIDEIAIRCCASLHRVQYFLNSRGFDRIGERRYHPRKTGFALYSQKAASAAIKHFQMLEEQADFDRTNCLSVSEIAEKLGRTTNNVRYRIQNLRLEPRFMKRYKNNEIRMFSPDQVELIARYSAPRCRPVAIKRQSPNEVTIRQMAQANGVSTNRISAVIGALHCQSVGRFAPSTMTGFISTYSKHDARRVAEYLKTVTSKKY